MARLLVHVEGQTEETFVNEILRSHLLHCGYESVSARIVGNARLRSRRGGIRPWLAVRKDIINHLREDRVASQPPWWISTACRKTESEHGRDARQPPARRVTRRHRSWKRPYAMTWPMRWGQALIYAILALRGGARVRRSAF